MAMSDRDRRALIIGGVLLAVIFGVRFGVQPWIDSWQQARQRIAQADSTLASLQAEADRRAQQNQQLIELLGPGALAEPAPLEQAKVQFGDTVRQVLSESNVGFSQFNPQPARGVRDMPGLVVIGVRIETSCGAQQLAQCLANLRGRDQLILVDRLTAEKSGNGDSFDVTLVLTSLAQADATGETR